MGEIKERSVVVLGAALMAVIGRDRFYQLAQDRHGISGRIASGFCQGHAGRVGQNYAIFREEQDKTRITDIALRFYSDDSLHGFGDVEYSTRADGKPLLDQQRGLIIPLVERAIGPDTKSVLEIGTGNGDVLAHLAGQHPEVEFTGVDLSIVNTRRHKAANLRFVKGYALDLLANGLHADITFGTSTFCVFAPKEFAAYLDAIKSRRLIISDPVTFGNVHDRDPKPRSRHMDSYMWWHNYFGYLTARGWTVDHLATVPYSYSHSPNCRVVLISARR